jgi:hypothetical protein
MSHLPTELGNAAAESLRRRKHERLAAEIPAVLRLVETRGGIYVVTVLDVSKSGLRISCPSALPEGTKVEIKCRGIAILGIVRYAREVHEEFHLGIEAETASAPKITQGSELDLTLLFLAERSRSTGR